MLRLHIHGLQDLWLKSGISARLAATFEGGKQLCGYTVNEIEDIKEIDARAILLTHQETGAQHLHVAREDSNNTFSVGFRTLPNDSTGISHILEHTTLCGSKKYPVRDPFFSMLTRSLSNFMNAFTANDWTMYLFSTQNISDFQNLLSVYLDCVFFPRLRKLDFSQEGWRLEHVNIDDKLSPVIFKGVVYNEMKGYFANSENIYTQAIQNLLFPTNTYSNVSGGTSIGIVDLKWEDLRKFHSAHYHPSNSYFITYGDIPVENHLEFINENALSNYAKQDAFHIVPTEENWNVPRRKHISCPPNPSAVCTSRQTTSSVSYKLTSITDEYETFVLQFLCFLLVDGPSSPFHKSLLEANLGSEFSPGTGYNNDTYESYFSIGLQGIESEKAAMVDEIIHSTFTQLVQKGFPSQNVESLLNKFELKVKEHKRNFGLGLSTMLMSPWVHGGNPINFLKTKQLFEKFKMEFYSNRNFLRSRILKYFVENTHKLYLTMEPNVQYQEKQRKDEAIKLFDTLSDMSTVSIENIFSDGQALKDDQVSLNRCDCLPSVSLSDIRKEVDYVPLEDFDSICPVYLFTQPTNGLSYFNISFDFSDLPEEMKLYLPLFSYIVTRMGASNLNYEDLSLQCETNSSGFSVLPFVKSEFTSMEKVHQLLLCSSYSLDRKFVTMMSLWEKIFNHFNFKDENRLTSLLKQLSSHYSMGISDSGHRYAMNLSASSLTPSAYYKERFFGLSQLKFLKKLLDTDIFELQKTLEVIGSTVFNIRNMRLAVHTDASQLETVRTVVSSFLNNMPNATKERTQSEGAVFEMQHGINNFVRLPFMVNFIGLSVTTVPFDDIDSPRLKVLSKILSSKYLHKHIREIGGAYGSQAIDNEGILSFMTYRDPNVLKSLNTIRGSIKWLRKEEFTNSDIMESKLSIFSELDSPKHPGEKGLPFFLNRVPIFSEKQFRNRIFDVNKQELLDVGEKYLKFEDANTAVIGNDEQIKEPEWNLFHF